MQVLPRPDTSPSAERWEYDVWWVLKKGADVGVFGVRLGPNGLPARERVPLVDILAMAGADGWELVGIDNQGGSSALYVFKRPAV